MGVAVMSLCGCGYAGCFIFTEVTVIIFIEVFVGAVALISGFVFKHTYYVSHLPCLLLG